MPPPRSLYDVFVVGAAAPGPAAAAQLAATLATQSGRPTAAIAQALAGRNLRVGHRVDREVADKIARDLQALGAAVSITPTTGAAAPPPPAPPAASRGFTLTPLESTATRHTTPPSSVGLRPLTSDALAAVESHPAGAFAPPSAASGFALPETGQSPPPGQEAFGGPEAGEASLELAPREKPLPRRSTSSFGTSTSISSLSTPAYTLAGASAMNTNKIIATKSASGLTLSDDDEAHTERCRTHGLLFDRRKSKGCRICVEGRRSASLGDRPSTLRDRPAKRAFLGFGFGLVLGLVPAAYYAKGPGAAETERLRAEQTELSERAGTEEILRRFDQIDAAVSSAQLRDMRNTLFIWVAVGGIAMFSFYRVT